MNVTAETGGNTTAHIPAKSRRQAMDWSLVLLSQGIESTVIHNAQANAWELELSAQEAERAHSILQQYVHENRRWVWEREIQNTQFSLHGGAILWCLAMAFLFVWADATGARAVGTMGTEEVRAGEWWRLFTAVTLHADLAHLLTNLSLGFVLLGLAMAQFGAGPALLLTWAAGVSGNVAGLYLYTNDHHSLGASGMVLGALGLLTGGSFRHFYRRDIPLGGFLRALAAGLLLLVLFGFSPNSDIVAHLGGFFSGLLFGLAFALVPDSVWRHPIVSLLTVTVTIASFVLTWGLAFR